VGRVEVISFAGIGNNEVSICSVISGDLRKIKLSELIVRESRG
jgi:hypothetical protein